MHNPNFLTELQIANTLTLTNEINPIKIQLHLKSKLIYSRGGYSREHPVVLSLPSIAWRTYHNLISNLNCLEDYYRNYGCDRGYNSIFRMTENHLTGRDPVKRNTSIL